MSNAVIVLTTYPDEAGAVALARELVTSGLAACVNILPEMTSVYRWKGELEQGREYQMVIKTSPARRHDVEQRVKNSHPYSLPEILVIEPVTGSQSYLSWIHECTDVD